MKTELVTTDWITSRVDSDGVTTHVVPMHGGHLERFLEDYEIVSETKQPDGTISRDVRRRPKCKHCASWTHEQCISEERRLLVERQALDRHGTLDGVLIVCSPGADYHCAFFRRQKRSGE